MRASNQLRSLCATARATGFDADTDKRWKWLNLIAFIGIISALAIGGSVKEAKMAREAKIRREEDRAMVKSISMHLESISKHLESISYSRNNKHLESISDSKNSKHIELINDNRNGKHLESISDGRNGS